MIRYVLISMKMASKSSKSALTSANCFNQKRISASSDLFDLARISNELMQYSPGCCGRGGIGQTNDGTGRDGVGGMPAGSDDIADKERQRRPEENKRKGKGGSDPILLRTCARLFFITQLQIPEHQFRLNRKPWSFFSATLLQILED